MSDIQKELARVVERFGSNETGAYHQALTLAETFILRNYYALASALADQRRYRWCRENLLWAKSFDGYVRWTVEIAIPQPGIDESSAPVAETLDSAIDHITQANKM